MNTENHSQTAAFLWSIADLLRGDFKQSQYGRIILPFTLLRRLECVLVRPARSLTTRRAAAPLQAAAIGCSIARPGSDGPGCILVCELAP